MNSVFVIINWFVNYLVSFDLGSWWNVCWGVLMIAWCLIFLLSIEHLVFMSINISTFRINWRSFVASLLTCWRLSGIPHDILLSWNDSWWWHVSILCLAFVVISLSLYLGASFDGGLDSVKSFALESWLRYVAFLSKFEINGVLLNLIFGNSWKLVSSLEILDSLWFCVRSDMNVFQINFLEICCWLDSHACWSLQSSLILGLWKSLCNLSQISWTSDCL